MSYNDPASDCTLITVSRFVKPCHTIFSTILLRLTRHRKRDPVMNSSDTRIFSLDIFILTMSFLLCYHRGTMTGKSLSPPCPYSLRNASLTFKAGWAHSRRAVHHLLLSAGQNEDKGRRCVSNWRWLNKKYVQYFHTTPEREGELTIWVLIRGWSWTHPQCKVN